MITLKDGRRFIVPTQKQVMMNENVEMAVVDYEWPVENKKLAKHILDQLRANHINHRLDNNCLFVDYPSPNDIANFCRFHEKTLNHSYTHFISLPLYCDSRVVKEAEELQRDAHDLVSLTRKKFDGPLSHAFMDLKRLHLTVCMLTIMSREDLEKAKKIIKEYHKDLNTISVSLKGLDVLKGTPESCRVLVANIDNCNSLSEKFTKLTKSLLSAHLSDCLPPIRWHMTLINGKYYDQHYHTNGCTFDVRKLLRKTTAFSRPILAQIGELHLSSLHEHNEGYYHADLKVVVK